MTRLPTVDDYLDAAKARNGLTSDRKLARQLGITAASLNGWRLRRQWPSEANAIALFALLGFPPQLALSELGRWRAKDEYTRAVYEELASIVLAKYSLTPGELPAASTSSKTSSRSGARILGLILAFIVGAGIWTSPERTTAEQVSAAVPDLYLMRDSSLP